ncbi:MAG: histidine kinase dimerization/phospho-acceptor domain-containing protein, partial [Planctomycetota bacterium]
MLGSRLARRIVVPLLFLLAALFGLLAWAAVAIAEARVDEELEAAADRVADALKSLSVPAEHRAEVLPSLARLTGSQLIVVGPPGGAYATVEGGGALPEAELRRGRVELGGIPYRVLARRSQRRPERTYVLTDEEGIAQRRRDVLVPILVAGAGGLLAAFGFGLLVTRSVVRPVRALAETARRVASGEFAGTLGRRGPGEIGDLEEAFGRMLEAIRRGEARLRETERFAALGRLAGGIAHELRNPLTAIRLAVESAAAEDDPRLGEEARRVALAEIERLERTLSELLHYGRPRPLRLEELSVARLLAECAGLLRPQLEHLSVALAVEAAENL